MYSAMFTISKTSKLLWNSIHTPRFIYNIASASLTTLQQKKEASKAAMDPKVVGWKDIIDFWYSDSSRKHWYAKSKDFDEEIRTKFYATYAAALKGELYSWRDCAQGRLAEIIVLDQFSRNMFRGSRQAFEGDLAALILCQEAIRLNLHKELQGNQLGNLLLPLMHSESAIIHEDATKLFAVPGLEGSSKYEKMHYDIIKQFGRYPHRNAMLGRENTKEEAEYLEKNPSGF